MYKYLRYQILIKFIMILTLREKNKRLGKNEPTWVANHLRWWIWNVLPFIFYMIKLWEWVNVILKKYTLLKMVLKISYLDHKTLFWGAIPV